MPKVNMKFGKLLDELSAVERDLHRMKLYGEKMGFGTLSANFDLDEPNNENFVELINSFIKLYACHLVLTGPHRVYSATEDRLVENPLLNMVQNFSTSMWRSFLDTPPAELPRYIEERIKMVKNFRNTVNKLYSKLDGDNQDRVLDEISILLARTEDTEGILQSSLAD